MRHVYGMCNKWMQPQTHWWQILMTVHAVSRKYWPTISLNCVIVWTHWYNKMNQYRNPLNAVRHNNQPAVLAI